MDIQKKEKPQKELEELKKQAQEYLNGWKRAKADLINYKKEEGQRMEDFSKYNPNEFYRYYFLI